LEGQGGRTPPSWVEGERRALVLRAVARSDVRVLPRFTMPNRWRKQRDTSGIGQWSQRTWEEADMDKLRCSRKWCSAGELENTLLTEKSDWLQLLTVSISSSPSTSSSDSSTLFSFFWWSHGCY